MSSKKNMPEMFEIKCPHCNKVILWCYERSVCEGYIQCPKCEIYIEVENEKHD